MTERRAVLAALDAVTTGLDPDKAHEGLSIKSANMPMAFEPPPTQAITASGRRSSFSKHWALASSPIIFWNSRTIVGKGGAGGGAEQVVGGFVVGSPVAQRLVAGIFEGAGAGVHRDHLAPISFMRNTLGFWRSQSWPPCRPGT